MTLARPGRPSSRLPRALATLLALALGFTILGAGPAFAGEDPPIVRRTILGLDWDTVPPLPCAGQAVALRFRLCECQVDLLGATVDSAQGIVVRLRANPSIVCVTCSPDTATVDVGTLAAGTYSFQVRFDIEYVTAPPDTTWPETPAYDVLSFTVAQTCSTPSGIPYLDRVVIGREAPCAGCPSRVCPNDSIDVFLSGAFPDDCTHLQDVRLEPSMAASPLPQPPTVRLTYGTASCLGRPCVLQPQPWAAHVRLPALPPGLPYALPVEAYLLDLCTPDSIGAFLARATFPFTVADSCTTGVPPPGGSCFTVAWSSPPRVEVGNAPNLTACRAEWTPGGTTSLVLGVGSDAPVAGVQGVLHLWNPGALRIREIVALPPGWQVGRSRAPDGGERFIAFAGPGVPPIPPSEDGRPAPLLRVDVVHNDALDVVTPDRVTLSADDLIVSNALGTGLPPCPTIALYPPSNAVTLCRAVPCDANGDGRSDVRDLVSMVNCLAPQPGIPAACPDSIGTLFDCDGSGGFDLDDVFCCVHRMLGVGAPPDSSGPMRDAPEIAAHFGVPQASDDGAIEVPLILEGMREVAAARLEVAYPVARYELLDVVFQEAPVTWWTLHQEDGGRTRLALVDLSGVGGIAWPQIAPDGPPRVQLRLRLRPGATPGGELAVTAHDFAAADGVGLTTPNAAPRIALAGAGSVALSAARPNPFSGATAFALTVPVAGPVDVGVFAANGRRVATLLNESAAAAGVYDLAWDGRQDAGGRAPAGVYFVRVTGGASDASLKVLFLPGAAR